MNTEQVNRWLALAANFGVLVGLILLVYEMRQNSELMRAQISMERANTNMVIMADIANGGELLQIDSKLQEEVRGFPNALDWSNSLTPEEKRRYQFWMFVRLVELNNDWFQCTAELMPREICQKDVRDNMQRSLHRFYELGIPFTRSQSDFVALMQEFARQQGLPEINDDGTWQESRGM